MHIRQLIIVTASIVGSSTLHASTQSEISNALSIGKSSNKNEVHYAVRVDDACKPSQAAPVRAYWQMRERSNDAVESLSSMELGLFGVEHQDVRDDTVRFVLRGLPSRAITVRTLRDSNGACVASASMSIAGVGARVTNIFVKQTFFGVSYVLVEGVSAKGEIVRERIKP